MQWPGTGRSSTVHDPKTNVLQSRGPMSYGPRVLCPMVLLSYAPTVLCLMSYGHKAVICPMVLCPMVLCPMVLLSYILWQERITKSM